MQPADDQQGAPGPGSSPRSVRAPVAPASVGRPVRRMSVGAVVGLVFALVACCPFVSLAGAIIGAMAYRRIAASGGAMRGRRVALTAMVAGVGLGLAGGLGWSWVFSSLDRWMHDSVTESVHAFMIAAQSGDTGAALRVSESGDAPLTAEAIEQFGEATRQRFGAFREFRLTSVVTSGSAFAQRITVAGTFVFDSRETPGSAELGFAPAVDSFWPASRLRSIAITDAGRDEVRLPASPTTATTAPGQP